MRGIGLKAVAYMLLMLPGQDCLAFLLASRSCMISQPQQQHPLQAQHTLAASNQDDHEKDKFCRNADRRHFFATVAGLAQAAAGIPLVASATVGGADSSSVGIAPMALSLVTDSLTVIAPAMKEFVDPYGMFSIEVPEGFYTLRRKAKGDLPDDQGKGRRGSSIFTAGNMAKAEVVAVERFPTRVLLEENGIEATGKLSTFPDIGEPSVVAGLINLRREKDRPGSSNTILDPKSVRVSADGKELQFQLKAEIDVQRPELLMEQYGVDRLFRVTLAKASLGSNDGNIMAVFASALETDFSSADGVALRKTVDSFRATEREFGF